MLKARLFLDKSVLLNSIALAFVFAIIYYIVQTPEDWEDNEERSPLRCLYVSTAVQTLGGFSTEGAKSAKLKTLIMIQAFLGLGQLVLF